MTVSSPAKEVKVFSTSTGDREFVPEPSITADFALVRAWKADRHGNLVFRRSARNFNPLAAMCGQVTIVEAEHVVEPGAIDPDDVHLPGAFVHRIVALSADQAAKKQVEKLTTNGPRPRNGDAESGMGPHEYRQALLSTVRTS